MDTTDALGTLVFQLFLEWTKQLDENGHLTNDNERLVRLYATLTGDNPNGAGALSYRAFIGGIVAGIKYADEHPKETPEKQPDLSWLNGATEREG